MSIASNVAMAVHVAVGWERESERREVATVTNEPDEKLGEKTSLYCVVCEEEQIFVWAKWSGVEFFGYPPEQEYGWECTVCGSEVRVISPHSGKLSQ